MNSSKFARKVLSTRSGLVLVAVLALAGCLCLKPECQLAIVAPTENAVVPAGDVSVCLRPPVCDFCTFPPKAYVVTLQDGKKVEVPGDAKPPCALFRNLGPGSYTATAQTIQPSGKVGQTAVGHFRIPAPTPAPTPPPTPIPPPVPTPTPAPFVPEIVEKGYLKDIFFDLNKSDVKPEYQENLTKAAEWLKEHPDALLTIEGHCDVRGSNKYNIVLGEKRAKAVKALMISLGVPAERLMATTVGEEQPFCTENDESCWKKNRRAHFIVTKK